MRALIIATVAATTLGLAVAGTSHSAAQAGEATETWSLRPDSEAGPLAGIDTSPVGWRLAPGSTDGLLTFHPTTLDSAVSTVTPRLDATVGRTDDAVVDIRGLRPDGSWTEWVAAEPDAVLAEPVSTVQARLALASSSATRTPVVRAIDLRATDTMAGARSPVAQRAEAREGLTHRVFATREGLEGGRTANGHIIVERDHFVALPSRRGLSPKGSGDYTVRVCTDDMARCTWAPVWDVGPWNTRDDFWNADRQMWEDLPRGTPQAQAAFRDGYNDGKDQFGRTVRNPAGIDLADGTFWDGLSLRDNAWVRVTYQWTMSGPWGVIDTPGAALSVRAEPRGDARHLGLAARHAQVRFECTVTGKRVEGSQGTSDEWLQVAEGMFIAAAYVDVRTPARSC